MTISEAAVVFKNYPKILSKLKVLVDVGLGHINWVNNPLHSPAVRLRELG